MGDVAEILGLGGGKKHLTSLEEASRMMLNNDNNAPVKVLKDKVKKPKGMSRELFGILGQNSSVPQMQANPIIPVAAFKKRVSSTNKGKWIFSDFTNSARSDDLKLYHWSKKDIVLDDYHYSKFNIKLDNVSYTDEEYEHLLKVDGWTKSETDNFMNIVYKYDLRWPVIADRYTSIKTRTMEELQARFYSVVYLIRNHRNGPSESTGSKESVVVYNIEQEKQRRMNQDVLFRKVHEPEESEEVKVKEETKGTETVVKKKKGPKPGQKAAEAKLQAAANSLLDNAPATAEILIAGRPTLQSSRLVVNESNINLSKTLVSKMQVYLKELGMPSNPLPTKTICDSVDQVYQDTVTLLSLHNAIIKKEKDIASLRTTLQEPPRQDMAIPYSALLTKQPTETRPFLPPQPTVDPNLNSTIVKSETAVPQKKSNKRKAVAVAGNEADAGTGSVATGEPVKKKPNTKKKAQESAKEMIVEPQQQQQQTI
jgi:DNA methyltransferase 1-associated protein 1